MQRCGLPSGVRNPLAIALAEAERRSSPGIVHALDRRRRPRPAAALLRTALTRAALTHAALLGVHFSHRRLTGFHRGTAGFRGNALCLGDGFPRHLLDAADHPVAGLAHELMLFLGLGDEQTRDPAKHSAERTDRDRVRLHHLPEPLCLLLHLPGSFPHLVWHLTDDLASLADDLTGLTHDLAGHFLHLANSLLGLTDDLSGHLLTLPALLLILTTLGPR